MSTKRILGNIILLLLTGLFPVLGIYLLFSDRLPSPPISPWWNLILLLLTAAFSAFVATVFYNVLLKEKASLSLAIMASTVLIALYIITCVNACGKPIPWYSYLVTSLSYNSIGSFVIMGASLLLKTIDKKVPL
jgi:hypothetical protein